MGAGARRPEKPEVEVAPAWVADEVEEWMENQPPEFQKRPAPLLPPLNSALPSDPQADDRREKWLAARTQAREALEDAVISRDAERIKDALKSARKVGLGVRDCQEADEVLGELRKEAANAASARRAARQALQDATKARDPEALVASLNHARSLGLPQAEVQAALSTLQMLAAEKRACAQVLEAQRQSLADAVKTCRVQPIARALQTAREVGVPTAELEEARRALAELEGVPYDPDKESPPSSGQLGLTMVRPKPAQLSVMPGVPDTVTPQSSPEGGARSRWRNVESKLEGDFGGVVPSNADFAANVSQVAQKRACAPQQQELPLNLRQNLVAMKARAMKEAVVRGEENMSTSSTLPSSLPGERFQYTCGNCGAPRLTTQAELALADGEVTCSICRWHGVPGDLASLGRG